MGEIRWLLAHPKLCLRGEVIVTAPETRAAFRVLVRPINTVYGFRYQLGAIGEFGTRWESSGDGLYCEYSPDDRSHEVQGIPLSLARLLLEPWWGQKELLEALDGLGANTNGLRYSEWDTHPD